MLGPWFTGCIAVATEIQRCVERELLIELSYCIYYETELTNIDQSNEVKSW